MRRRLAAIAVLCAAVVWVLAAWLLWHSSSVPSGLTVPRLDPHAYFSAAELRSTRSYARFERVDWVLSQLALLGVLGVYARRGVRFTRESAAGRIGTGMLLGMLGFAIVWLAQLPFGIAGLWWERRHGVAKLGYFEEIFGGWAALGGQFLSLCLALLIVMGLARRLGQRWWLAGAPVFVGLALFFTFVSPWLLDTQPLRNRAFAADGRAVAQREHVARTPVEVEDVHAFTTAPNAEATGFGPSRRVILWDTLTDGRFSRGEVRIVLAHEFGHLARHHLWKGLAWYALFAFPGAWLIAFATRRRGMADPCSVPVSLLVLVALGIAALPLQNAITRHMEVEADWLALETTKDPAAARSLFEKFTRTTLDQPRPPGWSYVLLENHPTVMQRIELVEAWQARQATSTAQSP